MKTPENRVKFMDELRANIDDVIVSGFFSRYWLARRSLGEIAGKECWVEYSSESAPQCVEFKSFEGQIIRLEFCENREGIEIYKNNKYQLFLSFDVYKSKLTFTAAATLWVERLARV